MCGFGFLSLSLSFLFNLWRQPYLKNGINRLLLHRCINGPFCWSWVFFFFFLVFFNNSIVARNFFFFFKDSYLINLNYTKFNKNRIWINHHKKYIYIKKIHINKKNFNFLLPTEWKDKKWLIGSETKRILKWES